MAPSDSFPAGLSLRAWLKCTLQDLRLFSESCICCICIFSCYLEQFITGIPSSVAAIPLQCLHQTRPCVFCLLFACTSSCLSRHFGLLQTLPPSVWSIPNPMGAVLGGMVGDSGCRAPAEEPVLFVGLNHFPFSCFSTKVLQSWGIPPWHPKQRKPLERLALTWLLPAAAAVEPPLPPHPPGPPTVPQMPWPQGRGSCPAQLRDATFPALLFFLLARFTC